MTCWRQEAEKKSPCRIDWHQTAGYVTVSIFAKSSIPENSWIEANHVSLNASIVHEGGKRLFEKLLILRGVRIRFFALLHNCPIFI